MWFHTWTFQIILWVSIYFKHISGIEISHIWIKDFTFNLFHTRTFQIWIQNFIYVNFFHTLKLNIYELKWRFHTVCDLFHIWIEDFVSDIAIWNMKWKFHLWFDLHIWIIDAHVWIEWSYYSLLEIHHIPAENF